jgi:hypothetical protein
VGTLLGVPPSNMTLLPSAALTTSALPLEILRDSLLALEQVNSGVTMLALIAADQPEQSPRLRRLLQGLIALVESCESDLGIFSR